MPKRATSAPLPPGFTYRPDFISPEEERSLLAEIGRLEFHEVVMHGVAAKRRTVHYGWLYGYETWRLEPGPPPPDFLLPLRARCAESAGIEAAALDETLVSEYSSGAGIGWHRDAPMFGVVFAVSLGAACRLRLRRGEAGDRHIAELEVAPRSLYILDGEARREWQHSIPAVGDLRYSITFRTLRRPRTPARGYLTSE